MVKVISFPNVSETAREAGRAGKPDLSARGMREKPAKRTAQKKSQRWRDAVEGAFPPRSAFRERRSRPNNFFPNKSTRIGNKVTHMPRRALNAVTRRQSNYRNGPWSGWRRITVR